MLTISISERKNLRARAHSINPLVAISEKGLTDSVLAEIDLTLNHHELVKIRVFNDDREIREGYFNTICTSLHAAPIQHIGKLLIIYRKAPPEVSLKKTNTRAKRKNAPKLKRDFQNN